MIRHKHLHADSIIRTIFGIILRPQTPVEKEDW